MRVIVGLPRDGMVLRQVAPFLPWLFLQALAIPVEALGMEFRFYQQPQLDQRMIIAEGRIDEGDADKLRAVARLADRDDDGLVALILNSPGGNVEAAFRLVDVMDKIRVYTVVPDNARCASACASILFASGERRGILGSGQLGFHSCYKRIANSYVSDSLCNEIVAANAMQRGVSHAAINRFIADHGARDMAWVGRSVACGSLQGLCKPGKLEKHPQNRDALMRSLDCSKVASMPLQLVCGDAELASVDRELGNLYGKKLKASTNKAPLRDGQRDWLRHSRNQCADKACLMRAYRLRIDELQRIR